MAKIEPRNNDIYYEQGQLTNKLLQEILDRLPPSKTSPAWEWLNQHRRVISIIPAGIAVTTWLSMLTYFLIYYLTLTRDAQGNLPRISPEYSTWPYISCIGANQLSLFRACCASVSILLTINFATLWYLGRSIDVGSRFRLGGLVLFSISNLFLILLSFASINSGTKLHLIFTSIQIFAMAFGKGSDYMMNRLMRAWLSRKLGSKRLLPRPLVRARWVKLVIGTCATAPGILTIIGIYGCTDETAIQTAGTMCFKIVSISAISEWILAMFWMAFVLSIAHDIWYLIDVREVFFQHRGYKSVNGGDSDEHKFQEVRRSTSLLAPVARSRSPGGDNDSLSYTTLEVDDNDPDLSGKIHWPWSALSRSP